MTERVMDEKILVGAASHEVLKYLEERQARRRGTTLALIAIFTTLGIGIGGFLVNELLNSLVKTEVERGIREVKEEVEREVKENISFIRITGEIARMSLQLAEHKERGVSSQTAERLVAQMGILKGYTDDPDNVLTRQQKFGAIEQITPVVEQLSRILAKSKRISSLNFLEKKFANIFERSGRITEIMVQVRGRQLIGQPGAPETWFDSTKTPTAQYNNYKLYAERAKNSEYAEMNLAFELIVRYMLQRPEKELLSLINDASSLPVNDLVHFRDIMIQYANEQIRSRKDAESERIARIFRSFLNDYSKRSKFIEEILGEVDETTK